MYDDQVLDEIATLGEAIAAANAASGALSQEQVDDALAVRPGDQQVAPPA